MKERNGKASDGTQRKGKEQEYLLRLCLSKNQRRRKWCVPKSYFLHKMHVIFQKQWMHRMEYKPLLKND